MELMMKILILKAALYLILVLISSCRSSLSDPFDLDAVGDYADKYNRCAFGIMTYSEDCSDASLENYSSDSCALLLLEMSSDCSGTLL